jgi:hypothetical protein
LERKSNKNQKLKSINYIFLSFTKALQKEEEDENDEDNDDEQSTNKKSTTVNKKILNERVSKLE